MHGNAFIVSYFTFDGGKYDLSTFNGNINCFNNAEEIVIDLCKQCSIGPVARHLFALYSPLSKLWIAPNHPTCKMASTLRELQLRIRFCPTEPVNFSMLDPVAFEYYFAQMRYDFLGACVKKIDNEILSLSATLLLVNVLEKSFLVQTALNNVRLQDFLPKKSKCSSIKTSDNSKNLSDSFKKKQSRKLIGRLKDGWIRAIQNQDGITPKNFAKAEFIRTLFTSGVTANALEDLSGETYQVENRSVHGDWCSILLRFEVYKLTLSYCWMGKWETICRISEMAPILMDRNTIRIARKNGYPIKVKGSVEVLTSLCSLLEGYYRFTVNPSRCLCLSLIPPSIANFQDFRNFAFTVGQHIFSQSKLFKNETVLQAPIDFKSKHGFPIKKVPNLVESLKISSDGAFESYIVRKGKKERVWKILKSETYQDVSEFIEMSKKWNLINSGFLAKIYSMSLKPFAIEIERFPKGLLDCFLQKNCKSLQVYDLLECGLFLTNAVNYLHDQRIVHGYIRCRTIWIVEAPPQSSFVIKLGDPFVNRNENDDQLWIAPENKRGVDNLSMPADIWALGTTLWEIFSYGIKPQKESVHQLNCPSSCPPSLWTAIQKCWSPMPDERILPFHIIQYIQRLYIGCKRGTESHFQSEKKHKELEFSNNQAIKKSWVIPASDIITILDGREEILGKGQYGEVIKGIYKASSYEFVAIKRMNSRVREKPNLVQDMVREFEIMTKLDHENVVSVFGIVEDPEVMITMEYLPKGSLLKFIRSIKKNDLELQSIPFVKYALDIAKGMEYLESKKIVHRDLAARNILMKSDSWVKISDFGLAQVLGPDDDTYVMRTLRSLPLRWYAPESIKVPRTYSHKSDVWSFGVTLWEIFSLGKMPKYPDIDCDNSLELLSIYNQGKRLPYPVEGVPFTEEIWQLLLKCWGYLDAQRPSFSELHLRIKAIFEKNEKERNYTDLVLH